MPLHIAGGVNELDRTGMALTLIIYDLGNPGTGVEQLSVIEVTTIV